LDGKPILTLPPCKLNIVEVVRISLAQFSFIRSLGLSPF
jgi:hypothetical protein